METVNNKLLNILSNKKAVIWDFDGVLCYGNWYYDGDLDEWREKLWKLLEKYDPRIKEKFESGMKYPYEHTDDIAVRFGKPALDEINGFYLEKELRILPGSPLNDGLVQLIKKLDDNIEHYIWSNNQQGFVVKALEKSGILARFKTIVTRDRVNRAKPNLDGFRIISASTTVTLEDFLFVGDSRNTDEIVARELGMDFFYYSA